MKSKESLTAAYIKPIIEAWLKNMDSIQESSKHNRYYIEAENGYCNEKGEEEDRLGLIQFYDRSVQKREAGRFYGDIMELTVYDVLKKDKRKYPSITEFLFQTNIQPSFYLHFEMHDFEFVLEQLQAFFRFLYRTEEEEDIEMKIFPSKLENILICCTAGLTSGYFAAMLQDKMDHDKEGNTIQVRGANVRFLPDLINDVDIVLLTPQIYYMEKELKEKYGDKIQLIDRVDFATFNFNSVLDKIYNRITKTGE